MKSRKVLIIAYFFPPRLGSGSVRPMGLAKYLSRFGWEPIILTPKLPGPVPVGTKVFETEYEHVLSQVKGAIGFRKNVGMQEQLGISGDRKIGTEISWMGHVISKTKNMIAFPDEHIGWFKFAVRVGRRLLAEGSIDAIISTSSPVTAHLIACKLKKLSGKPWIADFRDLWTQNHFYNGGVFRRIIERRVEYRTLRHSDAVVTCHPLVEKLGELHKRVPIHWIPNGFDPDEFPGNSDSRTNPNKLMMTYTGDLYQGKRDPKPLFQALSELISVGELKRNEIEVSFYGRFGNWLFEEVKQFKLDDVIKIHGPASRKDVLKRQIESTLLLILTWNNPHEASIFPGKVFEYFGAKRPILAIGGPGGVLKALLEQTETGIHVSDVPQLKRILLEYYKAFQLHGTIPYHPVKNEVSKFTHQVMAHRFSEILDDLVSQ